MTAPNPVLAEHRQVFESYLLLWQGKLGLLDWRISLSQRRPSKANAAAVKIHHRHRQASIHLADDLGPNTKVTPEVLESFVVHELLHVLLAEIVNQTEYGIEGFPLEAAEHGVIHTLQKLLTKGGI